MSSILNKLIGITLLLSCLNFVSCSKDIEENKPTVPVDTTGAKPDPTIPAFKTHQEWTYNLNMYEANVRQFSQEGTFNAFKTHLPRLKKLGVGIIWFMPIHPIGKKNIIAPLGSYYSVQDYKKVNSEFGTMDDFKELVEEIHKSGMYVILDWVPNHTSWDNVLIQTNPDWYTKDANGNFMPPAGTNWSDVIDLDYSKAGLRQYMISAMKFWVTEVGVDGFRCDAAEMVPMDFWDEATSELRKTYPGILMLAEGGGSESYHHGFNMTYAWNLHGFKKGLLRDIYSGSKNANDLETYLNNEINQIPKTESRLYFTSNHDENSWEGTEFEQFGDGANTFAVLAHTMYGMPLTYTGQEIGLDRRLLFFDKDPITWTENSYTELYTILGSLKKNNKALWNGEKGGIPVRVKTSNPTSIFSYKRDKEEDGIFVILNLSGTEQNVALEENFPGAYKEVFTGEEKSFDNGGELNLAPWGYKVFEKME